MAKTKSEIANSIEHTLLHPMATAEQVELLCAQAIAHHFAAVCVSPYYIGMVAKRLQHAAVKTCSVVGFPFGYANTAAKTEEIKRAAAAGSQEVDIVVNLTAVANADWSLVKNDLINAVHAAHLYNMVAKVIIETAYLTPQNLERLCQLCIEAETDYVKTSTGYADRGASVTDIQQLKALLPPKIKIKASGGIKTIEQAQAMLAAGASRLGTSNAMQLLGL